MFAKKLTDNTWMLTQDSGVKLGIAKKVNDEFVLIGKKEKYESLYDIAGKHGEKLKEANITTETLKDLDIEGFPIKHKEFHNVEAHTITEAVDTIYSYNNSEKSEVLYAAGYYGIWFSNQYVIKKSPKLVTILENDFVGPFKDEFTTKFAVSQKNKEVNV